MSIIEKSFEEKTTKQWNLDPLVVAELIAADLKLPPEEISVRFVIQEVGGDPMDHFPGTDEVTGIVVTHTKHKVK